jgi:glutathione synthase/RimK-type ligase-like ATP-grasp enzyme
MRILLSDGSGLTARQAATHLATAGHEVHVVSADMLGLARFTRHVRRVHRVPPYGRDPYAWLDATLDVLRRERFDALLPTQEQVAILSREADLLRATGVPVALPPFASLRRVQDKVSAHETIAAAGLAQPPTWVARSDAELRAVAHDLPVYVKTAIGTASSGVRLVTGPEQLERVAEELADELEDGLLVQKPVRGDLAMLQAIFREGELVAWHANLRVRDGVNGGAAVKRSVAVPEARDGVARLGAALEWHGALSLDAVLTEDGPRYIDVNPRLVEPGNSGRAQGDLTNALLATTLGRPVSASAQRAGVVTHQLLIALLGAAQRTGSRRAVLVELSAAVRRRGPYRDSLEELTPVRGDLLAGAQMGAVTAALLAYPGLWRPLATGAVENYALTPEGWKAILSAGSATPSGAGGL